MTILEAIKKYWMGLAILPLLLLGLTWFLLTNSVKNEGNSKQASLVKKYNETTNYLSDCVIKTTQLVGATKAHTEAVNAVITDAVKGRYEEGSSAKPGASNAVFSALVEAYPDTSGISKVFGDVMDKIAGCRTDVRRKQSELQNSIALFKKWRDGGTKTRFFGGDKYPTDGLEIKVAGKSVTGNEALDQMGNIMAVSEATEGRDTNKLKDDNPFEKG